MMNNTQLKVALKAMLSTSGMYCVAVSTIKKQLGLAASEVHTLAKLMGLNYFIYDNVVYVGDKLGKIAYDRDRKEGNNPFHQTS